MKGSERLEGITPLDVVRGLWTPLFLLAILIGACVAADLVREAHPDILHSFQSLQLFSWLDTLLKRIEYYTLGFLKLVTT